MLKVDMHIHSIASGHCVSTINEIINYAKSKKMTHIGITEHGPDMEGAPHQGYFWISNNIPKNFGKLKVYFGCEANIIGLNGELDLKKEYLESQDIIIVGLHEKTTYPQNLSKKSNTKSIVNAIKSGYASVISHPIRPEFQVNIQDLIHAAVESDVIIELNTQLMRSIVNTNYMKDYEELVKVAKDNGAKIIINSDAHAHYFVGDDFILKKLKNTLGISKIDLLNFNPRKLEKILELHRNV